LKAAYGWKIMRCYRKENPKLVVTMGACAAGARSWIFLDMNMPRRWDARACSQASWACP